MVVLGRYRAILAPAILAGALLLLAFSPVGEGRHLGQDEEVWWALSRLGAEPVGTSLEGQFLLTAGEKEYFLADGLFARLLPGGLLRAAGDGELVWEGQGGAVLRLDWHPLAGPAPLDEKGWFPASGRALAPEASTFLVLRLDRPGRGDPARLARELAGWEGRGRIYQTYVARLPGEAQGPVLERKARRLIALLGGRTREGLRQDNLASFSGYSPRLGPGRRTIAGTLLNVQVALRPQPGAGSTLVYVGVPLLPGSY